MTYDPKKHHRRSIRLDGYDYAQDGAYFVTVCLQGHFCRFGEIIAGEMRLNDAGGMVQAVWDELPAHYPGVETDAFVIMPNHVHGIIVLAGPGIVGAGPRACPELGQPCGPKGLSEGRGQPRGVAPTDSVTPPGGGGRAMSLADVVHRFKTLTTKRYADGVRHLARRPFAGRLWQRNYYEHIIRNDVSLNRIRQYILDNPVSWARDQENPEVRPCDRAEEGIP